MLVISLIFFQVLIFVGMIFVLKRIMTQNVVLATKHLEEMNQEYVKKEELVARQLEEAKEESQSMINKARQEAETMKSKIVNDASAESEKAINEARKKSSEIISQADKTREHLILEIDDRVAKSAIDKAAELIHRTLPDKFRKGIHSQWVRDLIDNGFSSVERLNIQKDIKDVRIVSAFEIESDERRDLVKKIKSILGREAEMKEEVDPKIVAGIVIRIGNLVLDGSLKNKIQEQAKNAKHAVGE
ncbi:MAG: F0F1 ATP synthase subunit delta [Candidatus Omnitrophota bacterium]